MSVSDGKYNKCKMWLSNKSIHLFKFNHLSKIHIHTTTEPFTINIFRHNPFYRFDMKLQNFDLPLTTFPLPPKKKKYCGKVVEWLTHQTSNLWMASRMGSILSEESRCFLEQETLH